jgi:hypothetical protein
VGRATTEKVISQMINEVADRCDDCTVHFDIEEQPMLFVLHSAITTDNEEKLVL